MKWRLVSIIAVSVVLTATSTGAAGASGPDQRHRRPRVGMTMPEDMILPQGPVLRGRGPHRLGCDVAGPPAPASSLSDEMWCEEAACDPFYGAEDWGSDLWDSTGDDALVGTTSRCFGREGSDERPPLGQLGDCVYCVDRECKDAHGRGWQRHPARPREHARDALAAGRSAASLAGWPTPATGTGAGTRCTWSGCPPGCRRPRPCR
jgi:hypothetical protein